jgi:hypothetical protein
MPVGPDELNGVNTMMINMMIKVRVASENATCTVVHLDNIYIGLVPITGSLWQFRYRHQPECGLRVFCPGPAISVLVIGHKLSSWDVTRQLLTALTSIRERQFRKYSNEDDGHVVPNNDQRISQPPGLARLTASPDQTTFSAYKFGCSLVGAWLASKPTTSFKFFQQIYILAVTATTPQLRL